MVGKSELEGEPPVGMENWKKNVCRKKIEKKVMEQRDWGGGSGKFKK